jgi:hypothetical protein
LLLRTLTSKHLVFPQPRKKQKCYPTFSAPKVKPMSTSLLDEILKGEEVLATGRRAPCLRAPHSAASSHARLLRSLVTGRSLPQALPCTLLHEGRHLAMLDPTARQPELPVRAHRPR